MSTEARAGSPGRVPALLRGLVDDAALFPPGNAPMPVAVAEHRHHRAAPYGELVGPLLCPVDRFDELLAQLGPTDEPLDLGLIGPAEPLLATAAAAHAEPRVRLVQVESAAPSVAEVTTVATRLDAIEDESVRVFVEVPRDRGWLDAVAAAARLGTRHRTGTKLRTGGLSAEAFPSDAELAAFVRRSMDSDGRFKLTAGLHHAVRHTAPETGFEHHGYLNVLVATCLGWLHNAPLAGIEDAIAVRVASPLVDVAHALLNQPGESGESRTWFASYGSCSVAEPLTDLVELGLLDRSLPSHLPAARQHA